MPTEILFVHSAGPQSGVQGSAPFLKHLRRDLGADYAVSAPKMPAPTKPSYQSWKRKIAKLLSHENAPSILVGHSLGGSVLLKYIAEERPDVRARGLFIVSSPYWGSNNPDFVLAEGFAQSLPKKLKIYFYQSRDDEVINLDHLARYRKAVPRATVRTIASGGHTFKAGLPELVTDIRTLVHAKTRGARS
ncbi:MAG TPA: alpha/beta fold hydrolase [Candidatus Didemnitutus sp.]|nr:alpha/beta fold hydrolase [Candidatus Didemnitutus sp.]